MTFNINEYAMTMARYNRWMNDKMYDASAQLSDAQRKADCGLFFRSIHKTLNHLLLCDQIWFARFVGQSYQATSLADELFEDFDALHQARRDTDAQITEWAERLVQESLPERLRYTSLLDKQPKDVDFVRAIMHFFNHQTHHRGQVTAGLSRFEVDFGVTDLMVMPPEAGKH